MNGSCSIKAREDILLLLLIIIVIIINYLEYKLFGFKSTCKAVSFFIFSKSAYLVGEMFRECSNNRYSTERDGGII
jgi:hypothetical protein